MIKGKIKAVMGAKKEANIKDDVEAQRGLRREEKWSTTVEGEVENGNVESKTDHTQERKLWTVEKWCLYLASGSG